MPDRIATQPIKLGILIDTLVSDDIEPDARVVIKNTFNLIFTDAFDQGVLDRPVELVYREVDGLPRGTVRAAVDAYGELCDEGCLAVFGPHISENACTVRDEIESRFKVPSIGLYGTDDALGEWTFGLPNGSMTDEPIVWAHLIKKNGHSDVGVLWERGLTGEAHLKSFRRACREEGLLIVAEESIAQTGLDIVEEVKRLQVAGAEALVLCGYGMGVLKINEALEQLEWDPPLYTGTALEDGYGLTELWDAFVGWIGLEQYDEGNLVGQRFLDRYEEVYGDRPEYWAPVVVHDAAVAFLDAFVNAEPLSPLGVKEALERVKMLPAASGAPGTRVSFGRWTRRGWMGAGYLVARRLDPDRKISHFVGRYD